jgi:3-oxo-5-alpha-steroid 4-dehydrogenase 1
MNISPDTFRLVLHAMVILAAIVFVALYKVKAGYGILLNEKWGATLPNKLAWMLMEAPVFIVMCYLWAMSPARWNTVPFVFFLMFQTHYLQRSFIFPWLIRGKNRMPVLIMLMGMVFNTANALIQGSWIFYLAPADRYPSTWLTDIRFILGTLIFLTGMVINLHSDKIIRGLREKGDTKHYLPEGGMFNYVTSANYFGEILEWLGFAILTWSYSGFVFFIWTFANLVPRAHAIYNTYREEFKEQMENGSKKRVFPFIY